jgi:FkbM family methyltransferase
MIKEKFCNKLGSLSRSLPHFRGKNKLMMSLLPLLIDDSIEAECIKTIKMSNGSLMLIDLRNFEKEAFFTGLYEPEIMDFLSSILKPNSIVFDVGANIGFYSISLGTKLKKVLNTSKIYAFEPVQTNFQRLKHLIELNELTEIVTPFNIALGNTKGEIPLRLEGKGSTGNAFWVRGDLETIDQPNQLSSITKLDNFVKENNIKKCDLIKVDIEGAELDFLRGGVEFINKCRPIILSEFNPYFVKSFGYSFKDIFDLVSPWRYTLYEKSRFKKSLIPIKNILSPQQIINVVIIPEEKINDISFDFIK